MGVASDPFVAADKIRQEVPDVITLDVEMPRMDGITFLHKIMTQHPIPVVMCSSLTEKGCETTLKALEYGAVEIIQKPRLGTKQFLMESSAQPARRYEWHGLCRASQNGRTTKGKSEKKLSANVIIPKPSTWAMAQTTERIVQSGPPQGAPRLSRYSSKHFLWTALESS